jgi:hypothetical protein
MGFFNSLLANGYWLIRQKLTKELFIFKAPKFVFILFKQ